MIATRLKTVVAGRASIARSGTLSSSGAVVHAIINLISVLRTIFVKIISLLIGLTTRIICKSTVTLSILSPIACVK